MRATNKLSAPDLINIGVFTALYFVLVTIATFGSAIIFPGFNNIVLPALCALISGTMCAGDGTLLDRCNIVRALHKLPCWDKLLEGKCMNR